MGGHKKKGVRDVPKPEPKVADYNVTGEISPDATCNYDEAGVHEEQPYYRRKDGSWFIWWDGYDYWYISDALGDDTGYSWRRESPNIVGVYVPRNNTTGNPEVSVGAH